MSVPKTLAIMQPTYLPWLGYFAMIDRVDEFIYLDSVQFARRSWQQRNRIKTAQGEQLLTIPVLSKGMRGQLINETKINPSVNFGLKHWRSIEIAYRKAPYFDDYSTVIEEQFLHASSILAEFNISLIETLCKIFGINTPRRLSSTMQSKGSDAHLLASICQEVGANCYISALGSKGYIEESNAFEVANISIEYHTYNHPIYFQGKGEFLPFMAALDLLFYCGPSASLTIIRSGIAR